MTAWIPLAGWAVFLGLHTVCSGRVWFWAIPELVPPIAFVLVPPAAAGVVLAAGPRRGWAVPSAVALAAAGVRWSGLTLPRAPAPGPGEPVVLFVWNTEFWDQGLDRASFLRFLAAQHADVLLLQENIHRVDGQELPAGGATDLAETLPEHVVFTDGELLTAVHRRLAPRRRRGVANTALRVDALVGDAETAFYNVHLPIQLDPETSPLRREFYRRLRHRSREQRRALTAVHGLLRSAPPHSVVGGDFNSSPVMRAMGRLRAGWRDAMRSSGRIYPATWPARSRRLWRIDWILTSRRITTEWARLVDPEGRSDHAGQLCALRAQPITSERPSL